jgi:hypothetical protein
MSTFIGNRVKQAYDEAGLTGWLFNEARVPIDPWDSLIVFCFVAYRRRAG